MRLHGITQRLSRITLLTICAFVLLAPATFAATEVVIWGNGNHMAFLEPLMEEYNASQDRIKVTVVRQEVTADRILAAHLGNTMPDIIESGARFTQQFAREGLMADLTPFIEREGGDFLSDFIPATFPDNTVDGKFYSLPGFLQIEGMYYNPEVLSKYGLVAPTTGWTWDDMRDTAAKARRYQSDGQGKEIWGIISEGWFQTDFPWLGQAGGQLITSDYQVTVNSSPVRDTWSFILDLINEDVIDSRRFNGRGLNDSGNTETWAHQTAFTTSATYRQNTFTAQESAFTTAPPLRMNAGSEPGTRFSDRSWGIMNVSPEQQEAAWEVVKHLVSPEVSARWVTAMGYPPATRSAIEHEIFQEYVRSHENMRVWTQQWTAINAVRAFPPELEPAFLASDATDLITQLWTQEIGLEAFVTEMTRVFTNMAADWTK